MEAKARNGDPIAADILSDTLDALEKGEPTTREGLLARFPGRGTEVDRVLAALGAYRDELASTRERRRPTAEGVLDAGTRLGDYRIHSVLGRGAMGVVYRATQHSLGDREVALKVLDGALVARDPRFLTRFRREAALASKVHAPHLAEVFDFGESGAQVFFAMRLVEGPSLAEVLVGLARRRRLGRTEHTHVPHVRRAVSVVRDAARGLAALHAEGLVHRDVKPSNILLARGDGSRRADLSGTATLVDFGLLRPTDGSDLTGSLTRLGTPAFAPPELMLGRGATPASDVFSLGTVLHDLLSLASPGERDAAAAGLERIRALNPAVDARLAAVLEKSLAEKPSLRYADGAAFADELERYLAGEPLRALPANPIARLALSARRNPARFAKRSLLGGLALLVLATLLALTPPALASYRAAGALEAASSAGDLRTAAVRARTLLEHPFLAGILPGLGDDLERARAFGEGRMGAFLGALGDHPMGERSRVHEDLLRLYFSDEGEAYRDLFLRFLTRELEPQRPLLCRLQAARTCAAKFLVDPVWCYDENGVRVEAPAILQKLREALGRAALPGSEGGAELDVFQPGPAGQDHRDLRRYATAALSCLDFEAFDPLLDRLFDLDPEVRRIALCGVDLFLRNREREILGKAGGEYARLPSGWLQHTAARVWESARFVLGERRRGYERFPQDRLALRFSDERGLGQAGSILTLLVALADLTEDSGQRLTWIEGPPEMRRCLRLRQERLRQAAREDGVPLDPVPADSDLLFRGWPGLPLDPKAFQAWNAVWTLDRVPDFRIHIPPDPDHLDYVNTWTPPASGTFSPLPLRQTVDPGARSLTLTLPLAAGGTLLARGLPATITSTDLDVEYQPGGVGSWHLQFSRPGTSALTIDLDLPPGAHGATLTLTQATPHRPILPWDGRSQIEISLEGGTLVFQEEVPGERESLTLPLTVRFLEHRTHLTLTIRYLGIEAIYWLYALELAFPAQEEGGGG